MKSAQQILAFLALSLLPLAAHAQTILFSDSFENYGTEPNAIYGYGFGTVFGAKTWTNATKNYGGPTYINPKPSPTPIPGQDGDHYVLLATQGQKTPGTPGPGNNTDILTTVNGVAGTFAPNTTYTLSVKIAGAGHITSDVSAYFFLNDGKNSAAPPLASNLVGGADLTSRFKTYTLTYTTGASGGGIGNPIQIGLEAIEDNAYTFGQNLAFDNVVLTASPNSPPTTNAAPTPPAP